MVPSVRFHCPISSRRLSSSSQALPSPLTSCRQISAADPTCLGWGTRDPVILIRGGNHRPSLPHTVPAYLCHKGTDQPACRIGRCRLSTRCLSCLFVGTVVYMSDSLTASLSHHGGKKSFSSSPESTSLLTVFLLHALGRQRSVRWRHQFQLLGKPCRIPLAQLQGLPALVRWGT